MKQKITILILLVCGLALLPYVGLAYEPLAISTLTDDFYDTPTPTPNTPTASTGTVRVEKECSKSSDVCKDHSCFWEQSIRKKGDVVDVTWKKGVEEIGESTACCNADRQWRGGHLKVWFEGENAACEVRTQADALRCGVNFKLRPGDTNLNTSTGFTVKINQGQKKVTKVEYKANLALTCQCMVENGKKVQADWTSTLIWDSEAEGDGTSVENKPPVWK